MKLIFLDLETTGLSPKAKILEIGALIVDESLTILDSYEQQIHTNQKDLDNMDEWCKEQHSKSGLIDDLYGAPSISYVESEFIEWLKVNNFSEKEGIIAGYSVHCDRKWISNSMPTLDEFLHYRHVDVSTIRELTRNWSPDIFSQIPYQESNHRALDDCYMALNELRMYKKLLWR